MIEAILADSPSPSPSPINRKKRTQTVTDSNSDPKKIRLDPTVQVQPLNLDDTQVFDRSIRSQDGEN